MKGVTLTDLQEAEKTIKTMTTDNKGKEEEDEKEKDAKQKKGDEGVRGLHMSYCCLLLLYVCNVTSHTVLTGSELEVSYRQSAEVRPAGTHAARWFRSLSSVQQERYSPAFPSF